MRKIQKLSELQPTIAFSEFDFYKNYEHSFQTSELGGLCRAIPFTALSRSLGLKDSFKGRKSYFSGAGKLALMFLKSYTGFSDSQLIDNLNSNIHYQLFCGVRINPMNPLTNFKIISAIRCEVALALKIDKLQEIISDYWKPYMNNLQIHMADATCYESYIRYPTDVKILWEAVNWLHPQMCILYKSLGLRKPKTKYEKQSKRYLSYSKKRKRKQVETRVLKRSLLHLLNKLIGLTNGVIKKKTRKTTLSPRFEKRYSVICQVYHQQQLRFEGQEVKDLIVSIDKSYIHPIVRGKETKSVEFGAKVNTIQVDGINFIEHLSFSAFHEGIRLPQGVCTQQRLFKRKVSLLAADSIYATNANRKYCNEKQIVTGFIRKGRAGKEESQLKVMRSVLSKERSTRLEGSFGTEKQHYDLQKVKARTEKTEVLWIFFGIHTANAVRMIEKMKKKELQDANTA
jgi:Transposase domain (DUF772).